VKIKLLMGAAIVSLATGQAWAQSAPEPTGESSTDVIVIVGQGQTR
jgi:hypothetical protein